MTPAELQKLRELLRRYQEEREASSAIDTVLALVERDIADLDGNPDAKLEDGRATPDPA